MFLNLLYVDEGIVSSLLFVERGVYLYSLFVEEGSVSTLVVCA